MATEPDDLCFTDLRTLSTLLRTRRLSARELMAAQLQRIGQLNPRLNAIVALRDAATCLDLATQADQRLAQGHAVGPLHGLPWAFKDLEPALGFPCTQGSPIYRSHYPAADSVLVARLRQAGVLPIGKTNVPEFAMGSHTYNRVYGTTLNPWDPTCSAGGSSGGAAVAVACGMLAAADGGDLGGSLRNPGNFNNVVGFRPSVGLVPNAPTPLPFLALSSKGPIARSVADAAFLLSILAGAHDEDFATYPSEPARFAGSLSRDFKGARVAWCPDLGGLPLDPQVRTVLEAQRSLFESLGCVVEEAAPDLREAEEVFLVLRAWRAWTAHGTLLDTHPTELKPEALAELEHGARLAATEVSRAMVQHAQLQLRMRRFQERHAFVLCAVNQLPPFPAQQPWPTEVAGVPMPHYIAWMQSAYWISTTACPAISVPAGFTPSGLPVGLQIVGRYRDDLGVLQLASAFEALNRSGERRPPCALACAQEADAT